MPTPFFVVLKKKHTVPKFSSHTDTPEAIELQALVKANNKAEYRKKIAEFKNRAVDPKEFRITKGIVYESRPSDEEITVEVALQIKGHSLTWYFWAEGSMDQYSQEFRDGLYFAASKCHKQVTNGCDLYYRGSNSVHIKLMHHDETESNHNHNHYRLLNNKPYTPTEFNQHLDAFKDSDVHDEFFMPGEIDEIRYLSMELSPLG